MRHDDDRFALRVQRFEDFHDHGGVFPVQRAGRLVGQYDVGMIDQRAGDGHALLFAAGQRCGLSPRQMGNAQMV